MSYMKLLSISEKNLALSRLYRQGADVVVHNKNRLEKIQKAILDKRGESPSSGINVSFPLRSSRQRLLLTISEIKLTTLHDICMLSTRIHHN